LIRGGESLARLIASQQGGCAFFASGLAGVFEAFFAACVTHFGAESAVFGGELGALCEEARGEKAYVTAGVRECDQRGHRSQIFGAQAGSGTAFARCCTCRASCDALFEVCV
jgi:hypothetical protein